MTKVESFPMDNNEKRFHLLKDGQRLGPFSNEELLAKLNAKEIFWDDLISDGGDNQWIRLSHHSEFRPLMAGIKKLNLPSPPTATTFKRSEVETLIEGRGHFNQKEIDFLVSMASVAKKNDKNNNDGNALAEFLDEKDRLNQHSKWQKWGLALIAGLFIFAFIGSFGSRYFKKSPDELMTEGTIGGKFNPDEAEKTAAEDSTNPSNNESNKSTISRGAEQGTPAAAAVDHHKRQIPARLQRRLPANNEESTEEERSSNRDMIEPGDLAADENDDEKADKPGIRPLRRPNSQETSDDFYPEKNDKGSNPEDIERADSISSEDQVFDQ